MKAQPQISLKPRKTPLQARSAVTVEAIFEATIQFLLVEGPHRLTTTWVAERAGVSVGTMYQYFPHKQSLLYAVLQQRLGAVAKPLRPWSKVWLALTSMQRQLARKCHSPHATHSAYATESDVPSISAGCVVEGDVQLRKLCKTPSQVC